MPYDTTKKKKIKKKGDRMATQAHCGIFVCQTSNLRL